MLWSVLHCSLIHCQVHQFIHCFLLNCYKLAMTLAVSSSSWNVLLIFSCVSFEVLYSIERACENAQLPKISHSRSYLFQVRHLLPDFSLGLPQVAFLCFYVERSHLGGEVIVLHEKQDQHKKCHQMWVSVSYLHKSCHLHFSCAHKSFCQTWEFRSNTRTAILNHLPVLLCCSICYVML